MQNLFGAGTLWATPLTDAFGNTLTAPSPIRLGVTQEISTDISWDTKELYGQLQFAVAIARGKGKISLKVKHAQLNGAVWNNVLLGQTLTTGLVGDVLDTTGAAIPVGLSITPTVPNTGTWSRDLGVRDGNGLPMSRVASAPVSGQYMVTAGAYTFGTGTAGLNVYIDYQYTVASGGKVSSVQNLPMGFTPTFRTDFVVPFGGKQLCMTFANCVGSKMALATKLDDFAIPEIDAMAFADPVTGNVFSYSLAE